MALIINEMDDQKWYEDFNIPFQKSTFEPDMPRTQAKGQPKVSTWSMYISFAFSSSSWGQASAASFQ